MLKAPNELLVVCVGKVLFLTFSQIVLNLKYPIFFVATYFCQLEDMPVHMLRILGHVLVSCIACKNFVCNYLSFANCFV